MAELPRWPYWGRFAALATASLSLLFFFVFGFLPQRFLLELDFSESGFAYPVIRPPLPVPPPPPTEVRRPIPRGPAERFWAEYVALASNGEAEAALHLLAGYLERYPDDLGTRLEYGRALWRAGRLNEAIVAYRDALARGADPGVRLELARLYSAAGEWDGALAIYEEIAGAAPRDPDLLREFAEVATWAERYDRAEGVYARLVALDPGDPERRLQWARVLYWSDRPERAFEVLAHLPPDFQSVSVDSLRAAIAIALPPPDAEPSLLERARGLAMAGAADSALALYRTLLIEEPSADSLLLEMADVFEYRANAPDSAVAYLRAYLEGRPGQHDVRLRLGRLLAWNGRLAEAEAEAEALTAVRPEDAAAWALLGDLRRWRGDRLGAAQAYQQSLDLAPEEVTAAEGLAALNAQVDAELARTGTIGPAGRVDYFADSDDFSLIGWRGGWTLGTPRARAGFDLALERVDGFDPTGRPATVTALDARATAECWWLQGKLQTTAGLGGWLPESGAELQPVVAFTALAPDWGGAAVRFEYRHEPAFRETATLQSTLADVRADVAGLGYHRPIGGRWDMSAAARLAWLSGQGEANLRADAAVGLFHKPDDHWLLGYESRALAFRDPAPDPGLRLYWDPKWSWSNSLLLGWRGAAGPGWELEARAAPGIAWLQERDRAAAVVFELSATLDVARRIGVWTVGGSAGYGQSRLDGYRTFRLAIEITRGF
ncbi:MAG: tetratricopeptide repeat protein [Gemmatimonadota bacterium]|nr:MAG: tetratricopeptide repeat protein [Gemmatimonadota bacterium]